MKRREILFLLAGCLLLMTPLQVQATPISNLFAVAESEETGIETEIETGDTQEAAEDNMLQSVLNEMSVGSALVGADAFQEEATQEETAGEESSNALSNILGASTVGSSIILECTKTEIEYAEAYEKAKNANWGYTNLGIADVESGNLNIRAVAAEDGKLVGKLPKNCLLSTSPSPRH